MLRVVQFRQRSSISFVSNKPRAAPQNIGERAGIASATPTNEIVERDSARNMPRRRIENSTRLFGTKALCQGGVQRNDTRRQEGFRDAARFAKRVIRCGCRSRNEARILQGLSPRVEKKMHNARYFARYGVKRAISGENTSVTSTHCLPKEKHERLAQSAAGGLFARFNATTEGW